MPVGAELANPWWLFTLPLFATLLLVARWPWLMAARRAGRKALAREGRRLALRLLWVSLLVLALAGHCHPLSRPTGHGPGHRCLGQRCDPSRRGRGSGALRGAAAPQGRPSRRRGRGGRGEGGGQGRQLVSKSVVAQVRVGQ